MNTPTRVLEFHDKQDHLRAERFPLGTSILLFLPGLLYSLPEFMDFKLFGKTILVVNKKFGLCLANQLRKRV